MCANWSGDDRDMSPDGDDHYRLDSVGLQIELGLPLQVLGVSLVSDCNRPRNRQIENRGRGHPSRNMSHLNQPVYDNDEKIMQTVDGIPIRKVYVSNIRIEVQRPDMFDIFGRFGAIVDVYLGISKNDSSRKFSFITFADPKAAARVLAVHKFLDARGRFMFVSAADSWHQPREGPDGKVQWKVNCNSRTKPEDESEQDDEQVVIASQVEVEINEGSLNSLNDDCLLHIFSFLSYKEITAVERVCKRWQALSYSMWRCLHELNFHSNSIKRLGRTTPLLEQYLRRCGSSLIMLDLSVPGHKFDETTLAIVAKYCSNLEILRVSKIPVGNRSLAHLGRSCFKLKQLYMEGCTKFSDKDLMSLLPKCHELSNLEFSQISKFSGRCLANVKGPVSSLCLSNLNNININYLVAGLEKMAGTLETLALNACSTVRGCDVQRIVSAVPGLTSFSLCQCMSHFNNSQLLSSIGQLRKLTTLNLHLNSSVNDRVLETIVQDCEQLTELNISGSGDGCAGILSSRGLSLLSHLKKLTHLDVSYLEAANNTALKNITARNTKLKHLICRGCPELSDEGTVQVVTVCNEMELLDLSGCKGVSEETVNTAVTSVKMRTNNVPLKIILGGTCVQSEVLNTDIPLLTLDGADLCEIHLRPDFIDNMFFPPSDSEEEEDLDHLCCDCDFDFDDLFDPSLLVEDDTSSYAFCDEFDSYVNCFGDYDDDDDYNNDDDDDDYDGGGGDGDVNVWLSGSI